MYIPFFFCGFFYLNIIVIYLQTNVFYKSKLRLMEAFIVSTLYYLTQSINCLKRIVQVMRIDAYAFLKYFILVCLYSR